MSDCDEMPEAIARAAAAQREDVEAWWRSLDTSARAAVRLLCDTRQDDLGLVGDEAGWRELPIEIRGRFVDPEDAVDASRWRREFIEYINAHPEKGFFLRERTFHICSAHADARRVLADGVIPADFVCPRRDAACPFESALRDGEGAIVFEARLRVALSSDVLGSPPPPRRSRYARR